MIKAFSAEDFPKAISVDRGIDNRTTIIELKKLFGRFGRILEIKILELSENPNDTTISATITFRNAAQANRAAMEMDGVEVRGVPLDVFVVAL